MPDHATDAETADVAARLWAAGCVFAQDEAVLLISAAGSPADLETMVAHRVAGRPLEQVVGWAEFCGLRIAVDDGVFVPRRRTEFLVGQAVGLLRSSGSAAPVVVDLCCGSGALAAALTAAVPAAESHAADVDPRAVACARRNVRAGGVYEGDLYAALPGSLRGRVEVLVANVPYVPSDEIGMMPPEARDHEPRTALDGGPDGLDLVRRVAADAPGWLVPGGHLLIETSERQAERAVAIYTAAGLRAVVATDDDLGATVVIGRSPPGPGTTSQ
jgi:release factor glutamine methyltransferase